MFPLPLLPIANHSICAAVFEEKIHIIAIAMIVEIEPRHFCSQEGYPIVGRRGWICSLKLYFLGDSTFQKLSVPYFNHQFSDRDNVE